jgi:hypothetical protein
MSGKKADRSTLIFVSSASVWGAAADELALLPASAAAAFLSIRDLSTAANGESIPFPFAGFELSPGDAVASL